MLENSAGRVIFGTNEPKLGGPEGGSALMGLFPLTLDGCGFMLGATHELVQ